MPSAHTWAVTNYEILSLISLHLPITLFLHAYTVVHSLLRLIVWYSALYTTCSWV